jgi:hypothetical protein
MTYWFITNEAAVRPVENLHCCGKCPFAALYFSSMKFKTYGGMEIF